ncbi:3362_t:CDS:1 [Funneliformis mosseae]|uniref:3362_t:CDS:1 n=1 Tax=Funneliformis mosseae TaxID=27381 RepID=A0A9N8WFQ4_FUNMO|nr:3362_t:CDS:1 [Funneliformis mosseae]
MTVSTIPIPQIIKIGVLIGAKGCNLKPIGEDTGTSIHVNTKVSPARNEIRIKWNSLPPSENRVNEARDQLDNLINKLLKRSNHSIVRNAQRVQRARKLESLNKLKEFN